jgi:transglutaminase-like putative cysteine protease
VDLRSQEADPQNTRFEYLLVDRQLRIERESSSAYTHVVMHLGNESAVDEQSHVQITYRPSLEQIVFHSLWVRRGPTEIDQLQRARMSTLRRELDLEQGIIDGQLTASFVLEDVRVGDVLEYSYTRLARPNSLGAAFSDWYTTQWSVPARHSYLRVLHPQSRSIHVKNLNTSAQPVTRSMGQQQELVWQWRDLASVPDEDRRPGWVFYYPAIQLSEYSNWQELAYWVQRLYPEVPLSSQMRTLIQQWRESGTTQAEQIVLALRFVQDEIRYTGLEIGPGGYKPQSPEVVLDRRFGDCKEKSYLLVTLLRGLGVKAQPVLVDTYRKAAVRDLMPSPSVFNHVIVRVEHENKIFWFDATASMQGGTLETIEQAQFGAGLVIGETNDFQAMPARMLHEPNQVVIETYDMTAGVFAKATMEVESRYSGSEADRMRRYLASRTLQEVSRTYLNWYKDELPAISVGTPIRIDDDRQRNKLVVHESYTLDPAFTKREGEDKHYFEISAHPIKNVVTKPKTIVRTSPVQLDHPTHVRYQAIMRLPESWSTEPLDNTIADPGFSYHSWVEHKPRIITANFEFKTLKDYVSAADVPDLARKLESVLDDAYYYLSYTPRAKTKPQPRSLSIVMLVAVAIGALGAALMIRWLHQYDDPRFPRSPSANAPEGIKGWLVIPALGVVLSPITAGYTLYSYRAYFDAATWSSLGHGADPVIAHWGRIGLFFLVALGCCAFLVMIFLNYLMFTKRKAFPPGYVAVLCMGVLWSVLGIVVFYALGQIETPEVTRRIGASIRDLIVAMLWIAYMLRSERVRATFTEAKVSESVRATVPSQVSAT